HTRSKRDWSSDVCSSDLQTVDSEKRLEQPQQKESGQFRDLRWNDALAAGASAIRNAITEGGPESVAVIGGARLTNEAAYAWAKQIGRASCRERVGGTRAL